MSDIELIDKLCDVTTVLADIVRKQAAIIQQHGLILDDGGSLEALIKEADEQLDIIEIANRQNV